MGLTIKTKTVETIRVKAHVGQRDIEEGKCGLISKCMGRIALERALRNLDPKGGDHKVKIDGGNVSFVLQGHRWRGFAPKELKCPLIQFDKERKARERAERLGLPFVTKVKPFTFTVEAHKGAKIQPFTRERQEQVNEARRKRAAEGRPDKRNYDLRYRVEGLGHV
jgi:hypothetical protein